MESPHPLCDIEPRSKEELETIIQSAYETDPVELEGVLPPSGYSTRIEYAVKTSGTDTTEVSIDGIDFTVNGLLIPMQDTVSPPFKELARAIDLLYQWTACVRALDGQRLTALMSENALRWACAPQDPFNSERSPASLICGKDGPARTLGSLPLVVVDAAQLSDGRIVMTISDVANLLVNPVWPPASLWVFAKIGETWWIDGIIGGLTLYGGVSGADAITID